MRKKRSKPDKLQKTADILTFICVISLVILYLMILNAPSGMAALGILFPMMIAGGIHLFLGSVALITAFTTRNHWRNSWIYLYFACLILGILGYSGFFHNMQRSTMVRVEKFQHRDEMNLYQAIRRKDLTEVEKILKSDPELSFCSQWDRRLENFSPLQYSILYGNFQTTRKLLSAGADPNFSCQKRAHIGRSPMVSAAIKLDVKTVKLLLKHNAKIPSAPNSRCILALTIAGAAYSLPFNHNETAHYIKKGRDSGKIREIVKILLDAGAPVDALMHNATALHWALVLNDAKLVDTLLKAGAAPDLQERSALILAITYRHPALAERLINNNPPADISGLKGFRALLTAARNNDEKTIALLIKSGFSLKPLYDQNIKLKNGSQLDINRELYQAFKNNQPLTIKALLAAGADINRPFKTRDWSRSMTIAGRLAYDLEKLNKVVASGGDVNAPNQYGLTPLHLYAGCKYCADPLPAMRNLLRLGADINALDQKGETPLAKAVRLKLKDTEKFLRENGARLGISK